LTPKALTEKKGRKRGGGLVSAPRKNTGSLIAPVRMGKQRSDAEGGREGPICWGPS